MGKASSSKKVARAAGIGGGRVHRRQTPWAYYGIIALIVILGVVGTVTSRHRRDSQINNAGNAAPTVGTTWHEGYAVYVCGKFLPAISTKAPDPQGITTRTAGVITIAPTVKSAAGANATLGKFADAVGMRLNAGELQVPGGHMYQDANSCEGKSGHVYVKQFAGPSDTVGQVFNGGKGQLPKTNPAQVKLQDNYMLTIAFVPASEVTSIPAPPASVISAVKTFLAQEQASSTSTSTPSSGATTATTAPAASSTTKPPSTTATTAKPTTPTTAHP
jgi:hypothetical protein